VAPPLSPAPANLPARQAGPVWVCTTNDGLDAVLEQTPPGRRRDLVFVQNGLLLPWLRRNGLQHNTQVLLYMAGEPPWPHGIEAGPSRGRGRN
jgi:hypothetical protein